VGISGPILLGGWPARLWRSRVSTRRPGRSPLKMTRTSFSRAPPWDAAGQAATFSGGALSRWVDLSVPRGPSARDRGTRNRHGLTAVWTQTCLALKRIAESAETCDIDLGGTPCSVVHLHTLGTQQHVNS
jgi:hypothetical protein